MKSLLLVLCFTFLSISFTGCADKKPDVVYVYSNCPQFTKHIDISIERQNDEYAKLHWSDVQKLKDLSEAQKEFNKIVQKRNDKNRERLKESLNGK